MITALVVGATQDPTDKRKQVFSKCVHITMDNLSICCPAPCPSCYEWLWQQVFLARRFTLARTGLAELILEVLDLSCEGNNLGVSQADSAPVRYPGIQYPTIIHG